MKPVTLFGWGVNAYSSYVSRQRRLNVFYSIRKDGDKTQLVVRGTPGVVASFALPSQPVRGWHVVSNVLYVVCGLTFCSVQTNGAITVLGTLNSGSAGLVSIADNGVQILIVDGLAGYIYTFSPASFVTITDGNFPNGTRSCAFLDGRFIVAKPNTRQFYVSEFYDGLDWTNVQSLPTFATKDNHSDLLISITVMNGILILFGEQTIEFWQDTGGSPLPFSRVSGATRNQGIAAQNSIAFVGDQQLFLGVNLYGGKVEVTMLQGLNATRVSTEDIEHIIAGFTVWQDAIAFGYILDGHKMYQITFPFAQRSFLYDITTDFWSELQSGVTLTARHIANLGISFNTFTYVSDSSSNTVYLLDGNTYTDNGNPIKRQVTTRHVSMGGNRFAIDEVYLDMETGVGLQYGQGSDPQIMMQVSKDGGRTFGVERWKQIGKVGQYKSPRVMWNRLGAAQDFVFQFTMTDPVKFTIVGGAVRTRQQEAISG